MAENDERVCWICYGAQAEFPNMRWVSPCRCRGSMQYVHEACLLRWAEEKELSARVEPLRCPQCNTRLMIAENRSFLVVLGDIYLDAMGELTPVALIGSLGILLWAGLASYGALAYSCTTGISIRQLVQKHDPIVLVAVLPLLPCSLIATRILARVSLEITVDTRGTWRLNVRNSDTLAVEQAGIDDEYAAEHAPGEEPDELGPEDQGDWEDDWEDLDDDELEPFVANEEDPHLANTQVQHPVPYARLIMGSLLLPFVASGLGNALFGSVTRKTFDRTMLGGIVYHGVRWVLGLCYQQQKLSSQRQRRVIQYSQS
eukprot:m.158405 g.158405  ORF g.158405 m.158405 type:complete len:315 (+) comp16468_c0_seq3:2788-3732(+)